MAKTLCSSEGPGLIPGSGRSPGEGNVNPLQYSCLENPMDQGAWWATVHGVAKSQTRLSDFTFWLTVGPHEPMGLPLVKFWVSIRGTEAGFRDRTLVLPRGTTPAVSPALDFSCLRSDCSLTPQHPHWPAWDEQSEDALPVGEFLRLLGPNLGLRVGTSLGSRPYGT